MGGGRRETGREASVEIRGGGDGSLSWSSSRPGDENGLEYERISEVKPSGLGWLDIECEQGRTLHVEPEAYMICGAFFFLFFCIYFF